jgi:aryl-alcohol dehydrogenase-like predicted oxidoreductase
VTAPIIGPRTLAQFDAAQRSLAVTLDADLLGKLDEIFPGYQPAPEHYAW